MELPNHFQVLTLQAIEPLFLMKKNETGSNERGMCPTIVPLLVTATACLSWGLSSSV